MALKSEVASLAEQMANLTMQFADGMGAAFANAIVWGENFGRSMRNLFKQILADIIQMVIRAGIQKAIASLMAQIGEGSGSKKKAKD